LIEGTRKSLADIFAPAARVQFARDYRADHAHLDAESLEESRFLRSEGELLMRGLMQQVEQDGDMPQTARARTATARVPSSSRAETVAATAHVHKGVPAIPPPSSESD